VRFTKLEATGNDYVLVDASSHASADPAGLARALCDRRRGVGADGLLLLLPPDATPAGADAAVARMRMFNPDGSEGRMCGNGLRCVVRYLTERGRWPARGGRVQTAVGPRRGHVGEDGSIEVELGRPTVTPTPRPLPAALAAELRADPDAAFLADVGNLHLVVRVAEPQGVDLARTAAALATAPDLPDGANVHVLAVHAPSRLVVRPFERGAGATLACGSGAVAAAAVAWELGWLEDPRVTVQMPGGLLRVRRDAEGMALLSGAARSVFAGEWSPS